MSLISVEIKEDENKCKGLFFRGKINSYYIEGKKIVQAFEINLLKKMSCKGCDQCYGFWDYYNTCGTEDIDITEIKHGKIYSPKFIADIHDWETNIVDEWHYELEEILENKS